MSKKIKNILLRADSSSKIGTGHIMRDLVFASQFVKKDSNITFATQNLAGNINKKIKEAGYKLKILKSNSTKEIDKLIKKLKIDLLVIDHYSISYKDEKKLKQKNPKLQILAFDDTYEKHYCDILLNHNISADAKRYKNLVPKGCELRCGSKYTLIRDEFIKEKKRKREKIYDILVAMGGADVTNVNIDILKTIPKSMKICVLTTSANKNLKELQEFVATRQNIELFTDSKKVAKLINKSRFAIVTPSVMVHEVLFMGVDFLAIKTADNQDDIYNYLRENKFLVLKKFDKNLLAKSIKNMVKKK